MITTFNGFETSGKHSRKLIVMRKKAIAWLMYDEDLKKKILLKKKKEQPKVRKIDSWQYKKPLAVAG
jgi:hypothetical protein